jgi:predicted transposase YdaD
MIDQELLRQLSSVEEISEALNLTKESSYTKAELEAYDKYWDTIRTERTLIADAEAKGKLEGKLEGRYEEKISIILTGYENDVSISMLAVLTHLTEAQVSEILQKNGLS